MELCLELLSGGELVLEIGFGSRVSFLNLSRLYREIYGLDLESDCTGVAACFAARGIAAQLVNGSVFDLPYPMIFLTLFCRSASMSASSRKTRIGPAGKYGGY